MSYEHLWLRLLRLLWFQATTEKDEVSASVENDPGKFTDVARQGN